MASDISSTWRRQLRKSTVENTGSPAPSAIMYEVTDASAIPLPLSPPQDSPSPRSSHFHTADQSPIAIPPSAVIDVVTEATDADEAGQPDQQATRNHLGPISVSEDPQVDEEVVTPADGVENAKVVASPSQEDGPLSSAPSVEHSTSQSEPEYHEPRTSSSSSVGRSQDVQHGNTEPVRSQTPSTPPKTHKRSLTLSRGHNVSIVLISSALDTIAASREAKRSNPLRDSTQRALDLIRSGQGGEFPHEIFEPLRLACETRNEKLMIASLDCISKLISYSFFAEPERSLSHMPSPPPSPHPSALDSNADASQTHIPQPSLVDLVAHTITACHSENTPEPVSLQVVKALLSLVLSPTILVHHSSLLKAVRTVYNVFLLSNDPVNQMVAQGGLTQMVHHVFTRCRRDSKTPLISATPDIFSPDAMAASRTSFSIPSEDARTLANIDVGTPEKSKSNASSASLPLQRPAEDTAPDQEPASNDDPNQSQIHL